jgi:hypothetical protein
LVGFLGVVTSRMSNSFGIDFPNQLRIIYNMRTKHNLWRVSNGWLLVPEECTGYLDSASASGCAVFKTLKEFADQYPKRERRVRKSKTDTTKDIQHANIT